MPIHTDQIEPCVREWSQKDHTLDERLKKAYQHKLTMETVNGITGWDGDLERAILYGYLFKIGLPPVCIEVFLDNLPGLLEEDPTLETFLKKPITPEIYRNLFSGSRLNNLKKLIIDTLYAQSAAKHKDDDNKYYKLSDTAFDAVVGYDPKYRYPPSRFWTCDNRSESGCVYNSGTYGVNFGTIIYVLHDGFIFSDNPSHVGVMSPAHRGGKNSCCVSFYQGTELWPKDWEYCRHDRAEQVVRWFHFKKFGKRRTELLTLLLHLGYERNPPGVEFRCGSERNDLLRPSACFEIGQLSYDKGDYWNNRRCLGGAVFASVVAQMQAIAIYCQQMPKNYWQHIVSFIQGFDPNNYPSNEYCKWLFLPDLGWADMVRTLRRLADAYAKYLKDQNRTTGCNIIPMPMLIPTVIKKVAAALKPQPVMIGRAAIRPKAIKLPSTPVMVAGGVLTATALYFIIKGAKQ